MAPWKRYLRRISILRKANNQLAYYRGLFRGSFSQHGEDTYVLRHLGPTGTYVDVGANDPHRLSNTYALYRSGWRGVTVDPIRSLVSRHKQLRPQDIQVLAGVGARGGGVSKFHELDPHVLSTFDQGTAEAYIAAGIARRLCTYDVPILTLSSIIDGANIKQVDLLTVDVEGYEYQVLAGLDFSRHRPRIMIIEALSPVGYSAEADSVRALLKSNDYHLVDTLGANAVYAPY